MISIYNQQPTNKINIRCFIHKLLLQSNWFLHCHRTYSDLVWKPFSGQVPDGPQPGTEHIVPVEFLLGLSLWNTFANHITRRVHDLILFGKVAARDTWDAFHQRFLSSVIKFLYLLIQTKITWTSQNSAHATTAELWQHVQCYDFIGSWNDRGNKIDTGFQVQEPLVKSAESN